MKKQVLNDGFKMWANYVVAVDNFTKGNDEKFGRFMRIICEYGIYGNEIADNEIEKLFFTGIKSSIEASIKNIKNGTKGGRTAIQSTDKPTCVRTWERNDKTEVQGVHQKDEGDMF